MARDQLERQGFTTFLASYLVRDKSRHISIKCLFNSYLFVSLEDANLWPQVKNTHGVTGVMTYQAAGSPYRMPCQLDAVAIESLRAQALAFDEIQRDGGARRVSRPRQCITAGCYVRVLDGIFRNEACAQRALVEWADADRAYLLLDIFKRKVRVEFYQRDLVRVES